MRVERHTFSGTEAGPELKMRQHQIMDVSILGDGSWSGTIKLMRKRSDGIATIVGEFTDVSIETSAQGIPGIIYYLECTSYSNGSVETELRTA